MTRNIFTTVEAARVCKVSPKTIAKWFDSGKLKGYRLPDSQGRRIPRKRLIEFLKEHDLPTEDLEQPEEPKKTAILARKKMVFRIAEHVCEKIGGDTQPEDIVGVIDMVLPDTYDEAEERFQDCIAVPENTASLPRPSMLDDLREALSGDHMTIRGLVEAATKKLKPLKGIRIILASAPQRNNPGEHVSRKPAELWLVEGGKAYRLSHCKAAPAVPLEWLEVEE